MICFVFETVIDRGDLRDLLGRLHKVLSTPPALTPTPNCRPPPTKPARLRPVLTLAIVRVAGNGDVVDLVRVVLFRVGRLVTL